MGGASRGARGDAARGGGSCGAEADVGEAGWAPVISGARILLSIVCVVMMTGGGL